jgi:putative endopeptidase
VVAGIAGASWLSACAEIAPAPEESSAAIAAPPAVPFAPGLAPVDYSLDPCVDFEVFACGNRTGPRNNLERPADLIANRGAELQRFATQLVSAPPPAAEPTTDGGTLVRDYLARCTDPVARNAGLAELRDELAELDRADSMTVLARRLGHLRALGSGILVDFTPVPSVAAGKALGAVRVGLSNPILPRHFYPSHPVVGDNRTHWEQLAMRSGAATIDDAKAASRVDGWLAAVKPVPPDDAAGRGRFDRARLERRRFPWAAYIDGLSASLGAPVSGPFVLDDPGDLVLVDGLLTLPFAAVKSYARILLIERWAEQVTPELLDEELRFHWGTLHGLQIRSWDLTDACLTIMPASLKTSLMLAYLTPLADPEAEAHGAQLFTQLRDLLALRLQTQVVPVAAAEARVRALARVRDTRPLFIEELSTSIAPLTAEAPASASFVALDRRVREAQMRVYLGWVGKPWPYDIRDAATSTACYISDEKRVWLSPPLLKPPYLGTLPDTPVTYGGAGAVMGHELAHGLPGALRVSPVNGAAAGGVEPYACLEEHFSEMARIWKLPFNGQRAVEEYTADLTGTRLALAAMLADPSGDDATRTRRIKEFFVAYAQFYCATEGDFRSDVETARDSHPSVLLRINGVVSQIDEFARAFACQPGQPMAPVSRCTAPWP